MARVYTPGRYKGRITKWALGETKNGHPQIAWTFMVEGRLEGGKVVACPQYERTNFRTITDQTVDWVVQELKAFGYDRDSFDPIDPAHPQAFDFEGQEVELEVKYEEYEGKERERWGFLTGGGVVVKPLARQGVSKLNATFGAKLKGAAPGGVKSPPVKSQPPAPTPSKLQQDAEEVF